MIEIVTHCYAAKIPDFAAMLTAQISSLVLWPPKVDVVVTVCCNQDDAATIKAIDGIGSNPVPTVKVNAMLLGLPDLFRRAIGRNRAAKASTADIVWFTDADYFFGRDCLDTLAEVDFGTYRSVIPRKAWLHRSHKECDQILKDRITLGELFEPDLSEFEAWHPKRAIGGLQIVLGDLARKGYLDETKWQTPVHDVSLGFQDTWEDRKYMRHAIQCNTKLVDVPGVYRMRHSSSAFQTPEQRGIK